MKGNKPVIIIGFVLFGLAAALWIVWFAALLRRYRNREKDEEE